MTYQLPKEFAFLATEDLSLLYNMMKLQIPTSPEFPLLSFIRCATFFERAGAPRSFLATYFFMCEDRYHNDLIYAMAAKTQHLYAHGLRVQHLANEDQITTEYFGLWKKFFDSEEMDPNFSVTWEVTFQQILSLLANDSFPARLFHFWMKKDPPPISVTVHSSDELNPLASLLATHLSIQTVLGESFSMHDRIAKIAISLDLLKDCEKKLPEWCQSKLKVELTSDQPKRRYHILLPSSSTGAHVATFCWIEGQRRLELLKNLFYVPFTSKPTLTIGSPSMNFIEQIVSSEDAVRKHKSARTHRKKSSSTHESARTHRKKSSSTHDISQLSATIPKAMGPLQLALKT
jgi:hypothetical protein